MRLHDLLSRRAVAAPERTALVHDGERMSYGALETASNRLAHMLRAKGCRRGDRVALVMPKTPAAIVAMFGALKADCAYVPVDPAAPAARGDRILAAAEPRLVLTGLEGSEGFPAETPPSATGPQDLAHLLFTSGSTGEPKGVTITHANVLAFVDWAAGYFGITAEDRCSGHSPLQFDLSTFDVYGTIAAGAELHMVPAPLAWHPHRLVRWMRDSRLTQWFSVPAVLTLLSKSGTLGGLPELKRLLWCGDVLPTPVLIDCMKRLPHVRFTNLYGPTEATIASSFHTVEAPPVPSEAIPIGRACGGEELLVLDEALRPAPPGEIGHLFIAGAGLSPGYWRDPARTAAVFLPDPRDPRRRIYRTGDLARLGGDGLVHFLGRSDSQIKSRGYRIELGEIEVALNTCDGLDECAVVGVPTDGFEGTAICCAFSTAPGARIAVAEVRERLRALLPPYMIPARWMPLEALPKNVNGKIDRPRIRAAFQAQRQQGD